MLKRYGVSKEYPFILLARMLLNFDYSNNVLEYKGKVISVNEIRKILKIENYKRLTYSLGVLEEYKLCFVKNDINDNKIVRLNPKIRNIVTKIKNGGDDK